jgi:hypothetical protein
MKLPRLNSPVAALSAALFAILSPTLTAQVAPAAREGRLFHFGRKGQDYHGGFRRRGRAEHACV